jgi:hypothetical protein
LLCVWFYFCIIIIYQKYNSISFYICIRTNYYQRSIQVNEVLIFVIRKQSIKDIKILLWAGRKPNKKNFFRNFHFYNVTIWIWTSVTKYRSNSHFYRSGGGDKEKNVSLLREQWTKLSGLYSEGRNFNYFITLTRFHYSIKDYKYLTIETENILDFNISHFIPTIVLNNVCMASNVSTITQNIYLFGASGRNKTRDHTSEVRWSFIISHACVFFLN